MRKGLLLILLLLPVINLQIYPRYYNPDLGRFTSADTVIPGSSADLQGLNRFSYCFNNPMKYIDPSGHEPDSTQFKLDSLKNEPIEVKALKIEVYLITEQIILARKGVKGIDTLELFSLLDYIETLNKDDFKKSELNLITKESFKNDSVKNDKKIPMEKNNVKNKETAKIIKMENWSKMLNNLNYNIPVPDNKNLIEKNNEKKKRNCVDEQEVR